MKRYAVSLMETIEEKLHFFHLVLKSSVSFQEETELYSIISVGVLNRSREELMKGSFPCCYGRLL